MLVAFGYEVVEVLILGRTKGFETEVIDDKQRDASKGLEASLEDV